MGQQVLVERVFLAVLEAALAEGEQHILAVLGYQDRAMPEAVQLLRQGAAEAARLEQWVWLLQEAEMLETAEQGLLLILPGLGLFMRVVVAVERQAQRLERAE